MMNFEKQQARLERAQTTQEAFPGRAVVRTLVQILPVIAAVLVAVSGVIPEDATGVLGGIAAISVALSLLITRVMASPAVETFLETHGIPLSAKPVQAPPMDTE